MSVLENINEAGSCRPRCHIAFGKLAAWFLFLSITACGTPPLTDAQSSAEDLARAILNATAERNSDKLHALALNEQEFKAIVWPSLPAARPERNLPFSYVWGDLKQKSDTTLVSTLGAHGGRRYELQRVNFGSSPARDYKHFQVHENVAFMVHDAAGREHELRLCGSLFEREGRWKVFSFVVDD